MRWMLLVLSAAALSLSGCLDFEPTEVQACEKLLLERVKTPATYRRVETTHYDSDLLPYNIDTFTETYVMRAVTTAAGFGAEYGSLQTALARGMAVEEWEKPATVQLRKGFDSYQVAKVSIIFDAENLFGAKIRSTARCELRRGIKRDTQSHTSRDWDKWDVASLTIY